MDSFAAALVSKYTTAIPAEYDWFAPLIGDWEFHFYHQKSAASGQVKGQWLFRRVLQGNGIADVFVYPQTNTLDNASQADGASSAAIRMFNAKEKCYEMFYASAPYSVQMRLVKEGTRIVGTPRDNPTERWYFSNIRTNSFQWHKAVVQPNGYWETVCSIYATRKQP